jgi:hypothetical protein
MNDEKKIIKAYTIKQFDKMLPLLKDIGITVFILCVAYLGLLTLSAFNQWHVSDIAYNAMLEYPIIKNYNDVNGWKLEKFVEPGGSAVPYYVLYKYHNTTGWHDIHAWVGQDKKICSIGI